MKLRRLMGVLFAVALIGAGCGDDGDGAAGTDQSSTTGAGAPTTSADAEGCTAERTGGTLTFGQFIPPRTLDPANPSAARGVIGGNEMAAIYDTLMRYDPDTGEFKPHLAESLESNDDASVWTLKLREGVTFGNGDPFDAAAVKASIERFFQPELAAAASGFAKNIASMETPDDRTLVFNLTGPWGSFPWFLSSDGGMIVNTNVVTQLGTDFGLLPKGAGAGPYEPVSFTPNEAIVLEAKNDYWGGPVCIETLRFITLAGSPATYEGLKAGTVDAAFLRDPVTIDTARSDGVEMFSTPQYIGSDLEINQRAGAIGTDPRIREAISLAIDPNTIDQRAFDGKGSPSSAIFTDTSRWYQDLDGPDYDPDRARQLVQEIIAEGNWDGSLRLLSASAPPSSDVALAVETMLNAVGFKVNKNLVTAIAQDRVAGNYDLVLAGINVADSAPYVGLTQLTTTGRNASGHSNPDFDAAVDRLKAANDDDSRKSALAEIQQIWNDTIPAVALGSSEEAIAWNPNVHGLTPTTDSVVLFDDAYIE